MTEHDFELLSQYLDDELSAPEAQALRKRLISEPALRAELEHMRAADDRVKLALDTAAATEVPLQVSQLLEQDEIQVAQPSTGRRAAWGLAIAASVLAASGLLLNPQWNQEQPGAGDLLAVVLEHSPSRGEGWDTLADGKRVRPVLSFRSKTGNWCREYLVEDAHSSWRGVACRQDDSWHTTIVTEVVASVDSSGDYRPAGSTDSDRIASYIDENAADIPLSAKQEAGLISGNWNSL